jgi:hypothetical protein
MGQQRLDSEEHELKENRASALEIERGRKSAASSQPEIA